MTYLVNIDISIESDSLKSAQKIARDIRILLAVDEFPPGYEHLSAAIYDATVLSVQNEDAL